MLTQKVIEDTRPILGGEADPMQRDGQFAGHRARVLKVLRGRAVAVVVILPIAHEESMNVPTVLLQKQGGDRGVDSAGEADDDTGKRRGRHGGILPALNRRQTVCARTQAAVARFKPPTLASGPRAPPR